MANDMLKLIDGLEWLNEGRENARKLKDYLEAEGYSLGIFDEALSWLGSIADSEDI